MDLDASLKGLHSFKARMEKLLDGGLLARLEAAAESASGSGNEEIAKHVGELEDTVSGIQQALEKLPVTIASALEEALLPFKQQMDVVEKLADPAVIDLLDWLASRREAIEVLCSLGDTADGTDEAAAGAAPPTGKDNAAVDEANKLAGS